jgi:hypothetical protein
MTILPEHAISMEILSKSRGIPLQTLRSLYNQCCKALDRTTQMVNTREESVSLLANDQAEVAIATCMKTGAFVQLTKQKEIPVLITIGKKFCIGHYDNVTSQTANQMTP